jgi:hypothetical protein
MCWPWHRRLRWRMQRHETIERARWEHQRAEWLARPARLYIDTRGIVHYTVGKETTVLGTIDADDDNPITTAKRMAARFPHPVGHVHLVARTKAAPPLGY